MPLYRDRSRLVANYFIVLGIVSLIGLNLGGLLWLWFAGKLRERNNRFRIAALVLCGLCVGLGLFGVIDVICRGTKGTSIRAYGYVYGAPPLWLAELFLFAYVLIHALPLVWLTRPATAFAYTHAKEMAEAQHCPNCQYNLTANRTGTCPECGVVIESIPAARS